jgi:HK97 family phage portal protein
VALGEPAAEDRVEGGTVNRLKRLARMVFRDTAWRIWRGYGGRADWRSEVGDPTESSLVAAILGWIGRTFPEAPPMLERLAPGEPAERVFDHPMLRLLERPNDYYTGVELSMATVVDWAANGDAYWLVIPSASGDPAELWWLPSWTIDPVGSKTDYLSYYVYRVNGEEYSLDPRYVVHFRYGLDPTNDRKGVSQLRAVLREIFTDNEAAAFTATILKNMGVPGIMVSPDQGGVEIDEDDAEQTKRDLIENFTDSKRGQPIVVTSATKVQQFGFNPEQLLLKELRRVPEERVAAVTGIPAIVVGFGAGLDRSTFTNMGEAKIAAYEQALIPMQRIIAEKIRFDLLTLYVGEDPHLWRFGYDLTRVRVFQEDLYRLAQRMDVAYRGGWAMRAEARRALGLPVASDGSDDVYAVMTNVALVPGGDRAGEAAVTFTPPKQLPPGGGSANGNGDANGHAAALGYTPGEVAQEVVEALRREALAEGV